MKFIVRWLFRLLLLMLVLAVAALLLKDSLLKELAETRLRQRTGLEAQIGRLEVNLLSPTLTVQDLTLFNPPEFGGAPFLEIPDGHLEYDRAALYSGRLHLRLLRLHIAELSVVRDARGRSNLQVIQELIAGRAAARPGSTLRFDGLDTLNLTFERVRAYQLGAPSQPTVFPLGLRNEILRNLRTPQDVERALLALAGRLGLAPLLAPGAVTNTGPVRAPAP